jgi:hypothetical protein
MDDRAKAALVGFNFGLMGYLLVREIMTGFAVPTTSWLVTQVVIGAVIGAALAAAAYFGLGAASK